MSSESQVRRWLRSYPRKWRARYGEDLAAYLHDAAGGRPLTGSLKLSLLGGGISQRARSLGLSAAHLPPVERRRSGALVVLCAWTAFVIAGAQFAKYAEHWQTYVPPAHRSGPAAAFSVVRVGALVAAAVVAFGALIALPALSRMKAGARQSLRRRLQVLLPMSAATLGSFVGLVVWAHHLTDAQRNGGSGAYATAAAAVGLLAAVCLTAWTIAAAQTVACLDLSATVLRVEAELAVVLTAMMLAMGVAMVAWWAGMASHGSAFFAAASHQSTGGSAISAQLVATSVVWALASGGALFGTLRIARASHPASVI